MQHSDILLWYDYNSWANRRILARAADLSHAQLSDKLPTMWDSILGTMAHVLGAEWVWRQRCQLGISPAALLERSQFSTLDPRSAGPTLGRGGSGHARLPKRAE